MPRTFKKSRGFEGELIIEIPKIALAQIQTLPLIHRLYISRMGFYPKAKHHYFQRPKGISLVVLLYCTAGSGWIQLKEQRVVIEAGEVYLIPKDTPHSYSADLENPWTIYWLHLSGNDCNEAVLGLMGEKQYAVQAGFSKERENLFKKIATILQKGYSASNLFLANLLLPHYLASFIEPSQFQPPTNVQEANATDKAILYMQQNLSQTIKLDDLAQTVHLSVSFFCRKFKHDTGYAPIEYFNHLRIQKACQLLHFSNLRINEVASQLGIDDPFYFSRLFKQQMGLSPAAYRKNEGNNAKVSKASHR